MDDMTNGAHDVEIMGGPRDGEVLEDFRGVVLLVPEKPSMDEWYEDIRQGVIPQLRTKRWEIRAHKNGKYYAVHPGLWKWTQKNFRT